MTPAMTPAMTPTMTPRRKGAVRTPWGAYVITSGATGAEAVAQARAACAAGARVLQYRDKRASSREALAVAREIRALSAASGTLFVVNDHLDVALLAGADGVHLGQDDLPLADARRLVGEGLLIGISTRSLEQAQQAERDGADYVGIGPVFSTPTKPGRSAVGLQAVADVVRALRIPRVAIGGIDLDNLALAYEAGARDVAMVRGFASPHTAERVRRVNDLLLSG